MREKEEEISLQDYIRILLKRKWIILTVIQLQWEPTQDSRQYTMVEVN